MTTANQVSSLYKTVVDDVINNVKEAFLDEGVDEQVLQELRQLWETKLNASKAMEPPHVETEMHLSATPYPIILQQSQPQAIQQGYVSHGVLTAAAQQTQQTFPVSITNQTRELSGAAAAATMALPVGLFQHQIAALGAGQAQNMTLQSAGNGHFIVQNIAGGAQGLTATITIPQQTFVQSQSGQRVASITQVAAPNQSGIIQLDGTGDTSSSEDEDFDNDDNDDDNEEEQNEEDAEQGEEEEPLNSADDVSEEDPTELFDAENVVVCQYDKINRNKNKWKFTLKDGIMNLNGRDFVFQKASGDAEW